MGLTDVKKNYIKSTIGNMLKSFDLERDAETFNSIYNRIEAMANKQDQCEKDGTPSTAFTDFAKLYYELFTNMVLPYAVKENNRLGYGERYENAMQVIFTTMPDNFVKACEKKNPLEIPEYNTLVKNAFLEKMGAYKDKNNILPFKLIYGKESTGLTNLEELDSVRIDFARISASYYGKTHDNNAKVLPNQKEEYLKHKESAKKMLGVVAVKYQEVNKEYNKLNFFQKWFWFTGYEYREKMTNVINDVRKMNLEFNLTNEKTVVDLYNVPIKELLDDTAKEVSHDITQIKQSAEGFNPRKKIELDITEEVEPVENRFEAENNEPVAEDILNMNEV